MWHRNAALALIWAGSSAALAETEPPTRDWLCVNNGRAELACSLVSAVPAASIHALDPPAGAGLQGLPPIVRELRGRANQWRGRRLLIPMFNEPYEPEHARELAQAVLCGASARCIARVVTQDASGASDAADFADTNDPLLASFD
jgi:hypothetical protein